MPDGDENDSKGGRRSLPSLGPPTHCEARAASRRSAFSLQLKPDSKLNQVALRQEAAERQAIERQKRLSSEKTPLSSTKSRSLEKTKPTPMCKGHIRSATTSSAGLMSKSTSSITRRPTVAQSKAHVTRQNSVEITIDDPTAPKTASTSRPASWYEHVLQSFHEYKPTLDQLLQRVTQVVHRRSKRILSLILSGFFSCCG